MSELRDDLENLLASPGWIWLQSKVKEHWGDQLATHVEGAANETDDQIALGKLRQVVAAHKAVRQVMQWPAEELRKMRAQKETTTAPFARGGI